MVFDFFRANFVPQVCAGKILGVILMLSIIC